MTREFANPVGRLRTLHHRPPHYDDKRLTQLVTFSLFDACNWKQCSTDRLFDKTLDAGHGACILRDIRSGQIVEDALRWFDGSRYQLHAWVIMPNHVHTLLTLLGECALWEIVRSWKSYSSRMINKMQGTVGPVWAKGFHDRFIRDQRHFETAFSYVEGNPVRAGLCQDIAEWRLSSAWHRSRSG